MRRSLTLQLVAVGVIALTAAACAQSPTVSADDIVIACDPSTTSADANEGTYIANAEAAEARKSAAQRIANVDSRYAPLAEALTIIDDAADLVAQYSGEPPNGELNWDLLKLAQAAAADQCELLFSQKQER